MLEYEEREQAVKNAIAQFPATFGLRAFPNRVFKIDDAASYVSAYPVPDTIYLYTVVQNGDKWDTFCKATPAELRVQIVNLK